MDRSTIVQWNCRGFRSNFEEIKSLISQRNPAIICLQETFLRPSDRCSLKDYSHDSVFSVGGDGRPTGGSSIFINNNLPHDFIKLQSPLQAVAARVHLHKLITVCSVYISPSFAYSHHDLLDLYRQLPSPVLLLGDFNAHSTTWGCDSTLSDSHPIDSLLEAEELIVLNDGSYTYIHPGNGARTAIDLSVCNPSLALDFKWEVMKDQHGSDHFPILLTTESPHGGNIPRWQLQKANWEVYEELCQARITQEKADDCEDLIEFFTTEILKCANIAIPKSSGSSSRRCRPWFDGDCKRAIRLRRAALQRFKWSPSAVNLGKYRQARAEARLIVKKAKRESWQNYVSKLNTRSSVKKTWDMIRKISGKYQGHPIEFLKTADGDIATDRESIVEVLADEFSYNSSSAHYSSKFQKYQKKQEKKKLSFTSDNTESYNAPFTLLELQLSLKNSHDTAVGPDEVHYQFLKHLPPGPLLVLLNIFNNIWLHNSFPPSWHHAYTIAIPKTGKDSTIPTNYRPISLTSCLCKTMERMVNGRLVHYLETNHLLSPSQSGFRSNRTTIDHLVSLETFIRDAFSRGEHVVSIFFDLEKAYDTTWKYGILCDLSQMGLRGHLPIFIQNFLSNRKFKVRLGSSYSAVHDQEMGVPQGSVLSVTLFIIKINSLPLAVNHNLYQSLYVDDFALACKSKYMPSAERQLQLALYDVQRWADVNGFKFSVSKTVCVHFCSKRNLHPDPSLTLNGHPIPVVDKVKFLGVFFDRKLNFKYHIEYVRDKCNKTLNLLRVVSRFDWGADRKVLQRLYRSLVRSRLEYGFVVYGSARPSYLKRLEPIQNQGLRLCLGAYRTSPASSLHVEANEMPLHIRRELLSLQYAIRLCTDPSNPTYDFVFNHQNNRYTDNAIKPLAVRIADALHDICPDKSSLLTKVTSAFPYWMLRGPEIDLTLASSKKGNINPIQFKNDFHDLLDHYPDSKVIYTDGSKNESGVACASVSDNLQIQMRLPDYASIFTAELTAILYTLDMIPSYNDDEFLIVCDSRSSIEAIGHYQISNPIVFEILRKTTTLQELGKSLVLIWCPSHCGILGNEVADTLAKQAISHSITDFGLPFTDFKCKILQYCRSKWQSIWDLETANKLHCIQPELGLWPYCLREKRREEIVLARCRIGHSHLTHTYLLRRELPPMCVACFCPLTVKHILVDCIDFSLIRQQYYNISSMKDLFMNTDPTKIIYFLQAVGLFYRF